MPFTAQQLEYLYTLGLAVEVPAHRPEHRRFVRVCCYKRKGQNETGYDALPWIYAVFRYEVFHALCEEHVSPSYTHDYERHEFLQVEQAERLLEAWGVELSTFQRRSQVVDAPL